LNTAAVFIPGRGLQAASNELFKHLSILINFFHAHNALRKNIDKYEIILKRRKQYERENQ